MFNADVTTYESLTTFDNKEDLNAAINAHRTAHKEDLTDIMRQVLFVIGKYAVKYPGVCYLRKTQLGLKVGRSRRTIIRICNRLEELGIIRQYETRRVKGDKRRASNAIVIQPVDMPESKQTDGKDDEQTDKPVKDDKQASQQNDTSACHSLNTPIKTPINNNINTHNDTQKADFKTNNLLDSSFLKNSLPKLLYRTLSPFFDVKELYSVVGTIYKAKASVSKALLIEQAPEAFTDAIKAVIRRLKAGEVSNLHGYLYATIRRTCAEIERKASVKPSLLEQYIHG